MQARGCIFQASYRTINAAGGAVPVVQLFGRLQDGQTFLVRDNRQRPFFYVRAADGERVRGLGLTAIATEQATFDGTPVAKVVCAVPSEANALQERLAGASVETFEADVPFAQRYLIERGIKGGCEIEGTARAGKGVDLVFDNPVVRHAQVTIEPRVLSFDIETDPSAQRLLAISLFGSGVDEVLIVDGRHRPLPERARGFDDERAALDAFCTRVAQFDPDVLTGWNVIDFDLSVLQRIAARLGHPFELGRIPGALRVRKSEGFFGSGRAVIAGRLVLDGIDLLRGAFVRMDDFSLDAVAREVLGEGKTLTGGEDGDRAAEISHHYRYDLPKFALYARTDARLAFQIVAKLKLVQLAFVRSQLTGMTPDRVSASIASFDFLYLSELQRRGLVAPSVQDAGGESTPQHGGHVLEPVAGLHENVWVFDFKSLYPSIIRTFNIDPLAYVAQPAPGADLIDTPGGWFARTPAILPGMLDALFPQREAAKRAGDAVASNAIKILMNSFYGVLGTPACRFHNPALANAITGQGREMLLWSKRWFEAAGHRVLYGDTDSLFVSAGTHDAVAARALGAQLAQRLNAELAAYIAQRWCVTSKLELEFEKLYLKLLLPQVRGGGGGARKRYAGLIDGASEVEFVGLEAVRRDWTALAKQVQRELYKRLFANEAVEDYLADTVRSVRAGALDSLLVYRKNLRKGVEQYTATSPPHVVAARKATKQGGRAIRYIMTTAGPEPLSDLKHPIDREHYVQKQIEPIATPVLELLGLDFERVIGDARQIEIF